MKNTTFFLLLFFVVVIAKAQSDSVDYKQTDQKALDFSFETGYSFMSVKNMGSSSSLYFGPGLRINPTPKFSFNIKTYFSRPTYSNFHYDMENETDGRQIPGQSVSIYAEGEYRINKKLKMHASFINFGNQMSGLMPNAMFYNNVFNIQDTYAVGLTYQLTRNINIGAEFRSVNFNVPYYFRYY